MTPGPSPPHVATEAEDSDRVFHPTWRIRAFRRGLHVAGAAFLVYYLLPSNLCGVPTWWLIPLGVLALAVIEFGRLRGFWALPSIRPHEEHHVASYVLWGGSILLILAIFPLGAAAPALAGAAFADPLAGELRARPSSARLARPLSVLVYVVTFGTLLEVLTQVALVPWAVLVVFPSIAAMAVEGRMGRAFDDDLWMPLVPAFLLVFLALWIPGAPHLPLHLPWVGP